MMQMSWRSAFAVDGVAAALVVGGTLATLLLVSLVSQSTQKKRKKAQESFFLNNEKGSAGSSLEFLPVSVTSEDEAILGQAEDTDRALGSPDKSLWTAHSAFESDTDDISETEMQERKAQLKETMHERVVRDDWYVYRREWVRFGEKIGEGGQAEIYAATVADPSLGDYPPEEVAVKKFKTFNGISQGHNPPGLKSFNCSNVCRPTGVFFDDGQLCLVMPRLNGDLRAVIDREMELHSAPPFPEPVSVYIIMQLAMGLKGLHEVGIYHRDLKAGNVLVKKIEVKGLDSYKVCISDFESSEDVIGTLFYRAPEVLRQVQARLQGRGHGRACLREHEWAAADVYSFGMVCYEILTGKVPKIGDMWSDFSMALSGHRPELPTGMVPEGLRIMIERCWHEVPQCRPTPSEIIECLRRIDNSGAACDWFSKVEMMATAEVTTGNLEDHVLEFDHLLYLTMRLTRVLAEPDPTLTNVTNAGTEFLMHVREFIPKFHALSHLPQQSFPLQKFMELRKLLSLIYSTKCNFAKGARKFVASGDNWLEKRPWIRMMELVTKIHAATNKTNLQRSRLAPADGLPIDEKKALLRDFVEPQLAAGVWVQCVCDECETIIRQMSDTKHRWALRCHLLQLCLMHGLRIEVAYFVPYAVQVLFNCKVLGWILVRVLGRDYSLFWYLEISPAIGYRLQLLRYIGARAHPLWYWRLLYIYILGNGEGFKYICLFDLVSNVVVNYPAFMKRDYSPHCDFDPLRAVETTFWAKCCFNMLYQPSWLVFH